MQTNVRIPDMAALFREVDRHKTLSGSQQPPRIGISANRKDGLSCISEAYIQSVVLAGGAPVLIPVITDIAALSNLVEQLDGLIISGGGDINPLYLNEEPIRELQDGDTFRDEYDLILLHLALSRQIPIMGICRGHQLLNVALGGTMYQDIHTQHSQNTIKHSQSLPREMASHSIEVFPNTKLFHILKPADKVFVNSFHHQAIDKIAPEYIPTAMASDGINEGIEHPEKQIFSVQWHPETMASTGNEQMINLFRYHVAEAKIFHQAKEIHKRILTLDSHTDTPMLFDEGFDIGEKGIGKTNLPLMEEGLLDAACMVAYLPQGERDSDSLRSATQYAINRLNLIHQQVTSNSDRCGIAFTAEQIEVQKKQQKKAILPGIENGYAIGKELSNIRLFKDMGVVYMTLCHNGDNDICDSARGSGEWGGLSPFGKEVIHEMNRTGMVIDISHVSENTFYDVLAASSFPVIASHSSVKALCNHPRNLTDDQIKALAAKGGVIQICLYKGFINEEGDKASLSDAIRHINHVVKLVGVDHVGIGSDFDGDGELIGCRGANELINITVRLLKEGYTEEEIEKIWGGNFLRVMSIVQTGI